MYKLGMLVLAVAAIVAVTGIGLIVHAPLWGVYLAIVGLALMAVTRIAMMAMPVRA